MIPAPQAVIDAINSDSRTIRVSLVEYDSTYGDHVIPEDDVITLNVYTGACGAEPVDGSVFVPYIEAEVYSERAIKENHDFVVWAHVYVNGTDNLVNLGMYWVTSVKKTTNSASLKQKYEFTAIDVQLGYIGNYPAQITSTSVADVIAEMTPAYTFGFEGVTVSGSFDEPPKGTYREVISQVAAKLGCFVTAYFRAGGGYMTVFAKYCAGETVSVSAEKSHEPPTYGEEKYTLNGNTVESGTIKMDIGNLLLEPFDMASVTDISGTTHLVPCLRITQTFNGGLETLIDAEVDNTYQQDVNISGPVTQNMQYFWVDADGAHVTTIPKDQFLVSPSGGNALIDSDSIEFKDGTTSLAEFGASRARVGNINGTNIDLSVDSQQTGRLTFNSELVPRAVEIESIGGTGGAKGGSIVFGDGPTISGGISSTQYISMDVWDTQNTHGSIALTAFDSSQNSPSYINIDTDDGVVIGAGSSNTSFEVVIATDGTMTANRSGAARIKASNASTAEVIGMVSDASSQMGLYDYTNSAWLVRRDSSGGLHLGARNVGLLLQRGNFTTTQHSTSTGSIAADSYASDKTATFTKSGYYPYGIVGVNIAGTNRVHQSLYTWRLSSRSEGSATVTYSIRNRASAAFNGTIYFDILWIEVL